MKTFLGFLVFMIAVLFSIQNRNEVIIRFVLLPIEPYQWFRLPDVPLPLFLVVLCAVLLGVVIGSLSNLYQRIRLKKVIRINQKTIEKLQSEIQSLRSLDSHQPSFLKKGD
jgi:uncharacterized integral membrane protein